MVRAVRVVSAALHVTPVPSILSAAALRCRRTANAHTRTVRVVEKREPCGAGPDVSSL